MRRFMLIAFATMVGCGFDSSGGNAQGANSGSGAGSGSGETGSLDDGESTTTQGVPRGAVRRRLQLTTELSDGAPLLVRLTPDRIEYDRTLEGGADVAFYDAEMQTVLPHEVEWWAPNDDSFVWVRLPDGAAGGLWMVYGGDPAPALDTAEVWDADFGAVWHFSSPLSGGPVPDSTANGHDGEWVDAPPEASAAGLSGLSLLSDGGPGFVQIQGGGPAVASALTVEAWVRLEGIDPSAARFPVWKPDAYFIRAMEPGDAQPSFGVRIQDDGLLQAGPQNTLGGGDWCYIAATFDTDDGRLRFFVDAQEVDVEDASGVLEPDSVIAAVDNPLQLARRLVGQLDEVRISSVARSQSWIEGQYLSVTDRLLEFGDPQPLG